MFNADRKRRGCTIYIGVRNCGYFQLYGLSFHSFPSSQFCVSKRCLPRFFFLYVYVFVYFAINISEDEFQSEVFDDPYLSS